MRVFLLAAAMWLFAAQAMAAEIMAADVAETKAKSGEITLIDIRRPDEWKNTGVAAPAHKISMHEKGFLERLSTLVDGKKDVPIALMCATGVRSTWLSEQLEKRGFTNIVNVREGMMGSSFGPGWLARGLALKSSN